MKQVVGPAVERCGGDDFIACAGQRNNCQRLCRLARSQGKTRRATLQSCQTLLEDVRRRIHDTGVDVSELLQREQTGRMVGIVEYIRSRLIDGHSSGLRRGVFLLAAMHGESCKFMLALVSVFVGGHISISCSFLAAVAGLAAGRKLSNLESQQCNGSRLARKCATSEFHSGMNPELEHTACASKYAILLLSGEI